MKRVMQDTEVSELRDLGLQADALGRQLARLRSRRERILNNATNPEKQQVTDHALVRFIERVDGIDMEAVKGRVRAFVAECTSTGVKGVMRHPTGLQVIVNSHGVIVTILPDGGPDGYEPS